MSNKMSNSLWKDLKDFIQKKDIEETKRISFIMLKDIEKLISTKSE